MRGIARHRGMENSRVGRKIALGIVALVAVAALVGVMSSQREGDSDLVPVGTLSVSHYESYPDSDVVTLYYTGSEETDLENECYEEARPEIVETDNAVRIRLVAWVRPNEDCNTIGFARSLSVKLDRPLGQRSIVLVNP